MGTFNKLHLAGQRYMNQKGTTPATLTRNFTQDKISQASSKFQNKKKHKNLNKQSLLSS
jgi:hypothetical protein